MPSFEEILKLYTDLDTDAKMLSFNGKLKLYLSDKTPDEKKFVGRTFLSLTRDLALQLLESLAKKEDIDSIEEMQKMLIAFRNA